MVANGGGFEKSSGNQSTQVWEIQNDHIKSRKAISSEKQFPKLTSNFRQMDRFGGFDFT